MQAKKKRLTLDMDPAFQRRLKATAALKGISMRQYCLKAIDNELAKDEVMEDESSDVDLPASEHFRRLRREVFGDQVIPQESAGLIGEAQEIGNPEIGSIGQTDNRFGHFGIGAVIALRDEIFGDRVLPGNSAELLREARDIRDSEIEGWA